MKRIFDKRNWPISPRTLVLWAIVLVVFSIAVVVDRLTHSCQPSRGNILITTGQERLPLDAGNYAPISITNLEEIRPLVVATIQSRGYSGRLAAFSPDSTHIATSNYRTRYIYTYHYYTLLWNLSNEPSCFHRFHRVPSEELFVDFNSTGDFILTTRGRGCADHKCYYLYDVQTGREVASFKVAEFVTFPDKQQLIFTLPDRDGIYAWDMSGSIYDSLNEHLEQNIRGYSLDGKKFLVQNSDDSISIWDVQTSSSIVEIPGVFRETFQSQFSPDGNWLFLRESILNQGVWSVESGELIISTEPLRTAEYNFTPDSQYFAYGSEVWELSSGEKAIDLGELIFRAYSPDGTLIVATDENGTLVFLNAVTGENVLSLTLDNRVLSLDFNMNGSLLAFTTGTALVERYQTPEGTMEIWGIPVD